MRYRTKPTYVDAIQFDGSDEQAIALGLERRESVFTKTYWWGLKQYTAGVSWYSAVNPTDWILTFADESRRHISNFNFKLQYELDSTDLYSIDKQQTNEEIARQVKDISQGIPIRVQTGGPITITYPADQGASRIIEHRHITPPNSSVKEE